MSGWTALVHPSLRKRKKKHDKPPHLPWNLLKCYPPQTDADFHTLQAFAYTPACTHTRKHKHELKQTEEARTRCLCVSLDCILLHSRPLPRVLFICGPSCLCCGQSERQTLQLLQWCVNMPGMSPRACRAAGPAGCYGLMEGAASL